MIFAELKQELVSTILTEVFAFLPRKVFNKFKLEIKYNYEEQQIRVAV